MKVLLATLVVFFVVGCTTVPPDVKTETLTPQTNASDTLKITNTKVKWIDNPNTQILMKYGVPAELSTLVASAYVIQNKGYLAGNTTYTSPPIDPKISQVARDISNKYIDQFIDVQRRFAAQKLSDALGQNGAKEGDDFQITVSPVAVYHAVDGFGTNLVLNTEFLEKATDKKWSTLIVVKSGILWTGVLNAALPTDAFAQSYVDQLMVVLKKSRAL